MKNKRNLTKPHLQTCSCCILLLVLLISSASAEIFDLTRDVWRFRIGDIPEAGQADFDDSLWDRVSVPHTWNALDAQDGKKRPNIRRPAGYRLTPAWYRQVVDIPRTEERQRTFIRCDGASLVKTVYVNGKRVGRHQGAFTAFCFEITDQVTPGEKAVIAIRVDNSQQPDREKLLTDVPSSRKTVDIMPLRGDFNLYGGIYRGIELVTKPDLCISPTDYASSGVYVTTPEVSRDRAVVRAEAVISASDNPPEGAVLSAVLRDAQGGVAASVSRRLVPEEGMREALELEVPSPHLWNGVEDPYLYELDVSLAAEGAEAADSVTEIIGIRTLEFDPERGFVLNDKPIQLRGVNRHQDWQDRGWAIGPLEHEIDFAMIREIGCNAVRLAHYPQDPYVLDLCDQLGLIVYMEIPLVGWIDSSDAFRDDVKTQLREMIRQYYNHPSIPMWGLWNELMNRAPEDMASPVPLVTKLNAIAHAEDPTRPTVAAANDSSENAPGLRDATDLIAWNVYPGWYGEDHPTNMAYLIRQKQQLDGHELIGLSEYGAGASIYHHEDWANLQKPVPRSPWHPEEYQAFVHEHDWAAIQAADCLWGTFVWNMFDFAADHKDEGDRPGINDKGLVTQDRKVRKDAFFFYKASWTRTPVVHVTSRRFSPRSAGPATIKVYSNAKQVELSVGGKPAGPGAHDGVVHVWENVTLEPGEVEVKATGLFARGQVTDSFVWTVNKK